MVVDAVDLALRSLHLDDLAILLALRAARDLVDKAEGVERGDADLRREDGGGETEVGMEESLEGEGRRGGRWGRDAERNGEGRGEEMNGVLEQEVAVKEGASLGGGREDYKTRQEEVSVGGRPLSFR